MKPKTKPFFEIGCSYLLTLIPNQHLKSGEFIILAISDDSLEIAEADNLRPRRIYWMPFTTILLASKKVDQKGD